MPLHMRRRAQAGFTLVELLVVMAIIVVLAGLLVAFLPSLASQNAEANGAANFQGWLNTARQKAIRNQNPFGVRLWVPNATDNTQSNYLQVIECSYIEQPEDFTGGTLSATPGSTTVSISGVDVTGGFSDSTLYPVQSGDYLELLGSGLMYGIAYPTAANPNPIQYNMVTSTSTITLNTPVPYAVNATLNYRIMRAPRVLGEERLPLPSGVIVDLGTNTTYNNPLPLVSQGALGASVDVLFSPAGSVITSNLTQNVTYFWVRLPDDSKAGNQSNIFAGTPTIIAVFAPTGLVGAYPPVPSGPNPYVDIH